MQVKFYAEGSAHCRAFQATFPSLQAAWKDTRQAYTERDGGQKRTGRLRIRDWSPFSTDMERARRKSRSLSRNQARPCSFRAYCKRPDAQAGFLSRADWNNWRLSPPKKTAHGRISFGVNPALQLSCLRCTAIPIWPGHHARAVVAAAQHHSGEPWRPARFIPWPSRFESGPRYHVPP